MNNPRAVIGTNSWGSAAYEKIIRGSVVNNDTLLSEAEMKKLEEVAEELNVKILGSDLFRFSVRK